VKQTQQTKFENGTEKPKEKNKKKKEVVNGRRGRERGSDCGLRGIALIRRLLSSGI
jgi:hypothetical protein